MAAHSSIEARPINVLEIPAELLHYLHALLPADVHHLPVLPARVSWGEEGVQRFTNLIAAQGKKGTIPIEGRPKRWEGLATKRHLTMPTTLLVEAAKHIAFHAPNPAHEAAPVISLGLVSVDVWDHLQNFLSPEFQGKDELPVRLPWGSERAEQFRRQFNPHQFRYSVPAKAWPKGYHQLLRTGTEALKTIPTHDLVQTLCLICPVLRARVTEEREEHELNSTDITAVSPQALVLINALLPVDLIGQERLPHRIRWHQKGATRCRNLIEGLTQREIIPSERKPDYWYQLTGPRQQETVPLLWLTDMAQQILHYMDAKQMPAEQRTEALNFARNMTQSACVKAAVMPAEWKAAQAINTLRLRNAPHLLSDWRYLLGPQHQSAVKMPSVILWTPADAERVSDYMNIHEYDAPRNAAWYDERWPLMTSAKANVYIKSEWLLDLLEHIDTEKKSRANIRVKKADSTHFAVFIL